MTHGLFDSVENQVFVFEDDRLLGNILADELAELGFRTSLFSDLSGVDSYRAINPVLIFLDLTLNQTDAVEVLQALSQVDARCPIQLISGDRVEMLDRVKRVGERRGLTMLPVLQKPVGMDELKRIVDEATRTSSEQIRNGSDETWDLGERRIDLGVALDNDWIEVWYQPKYDMQNLVLSGAEGLCRIRHPDHGMMSPGTFLPNATSDDLRRLTEYILERSCEDWSIFKQAGQVLRLAINIPCSLLTTMPLAKLLRKWRPHAADWPGLILEVTEEQTLRDIDAAQEAGTQLAIYGIDLSIDDFGTGYSSLSRLREIPFKEVKLDRSLVDGCVNDRVRAALCRTIIDLSHALGATTVAEGIETMEDLTLLREAGCDTAQGYLLARPMTRDALAALIREGEKPQGSFGGDHHLRLVA